METISDKTLLLWSIGWVRFCVLHRRCVQMKGLNFPGSHDPNFCQFVIDRSRHLMKPVRKSFQQSTFVSTVVHLFIRIHLFRYPSHDIIYPFFGTVFPLIGLWNRAASHVSSLMLKLTSRWQQLVVFDSCLPDLAFQTHSGYSHEPSSCFSVAQSVTEAQVGYLLFHNMYLYYMYTYITCIYLCR